MEVREKPSSPLHPRRSSSSQCIDGRSTSLAVWELSDPNEDFVARLTIKQPGLPLVTEILTTLTMNRMAQTLTW